MNQLKDVIFRRHGTLYLVIEDLAQPVVKVRSVNPSRAVTEMRRDDVMRCIAARDAELRMS